MRQRVLVSFHRSTTNPHTKPHRTGVLALTIICAAAVHLAVEQPAANLQRLLLVKSKHEAFPLPAGWRGSGERGRSMTKTEDGEEAEEEEGKGADQGRMVEMEMVVGARGEARCEV